MRLHKNLGYYLKMYTSNLPADAPFFLCTTLLVHPLGSLGSTYIGSGTMKKSIKTKQINLTDIYTYNLYQEPTEITYLKYCNNS
jgi:hypothetical protein